jgi:hypothetical protein
MMRGQIITQIENEYKQILNEMKMDGLDPFKDRVLNIDAVVESETKIRDGVAGNPFKGDVYAIEMVGEALVGQSIKASTVLRQIATSVAEIQDRSELFKSNYTVHRDFDDLTLDNLYLQFSMMYEDMINTITSAADSNGNFANPLYARLAKKIDVIDSLSIFLKDAKHGAIVDTSAGRGVLVGLNPGPQILVNFNDGFSRVRNNDFADHLAWNMEIVFPGDKESRTMSFDSWLRQGISVSSETYSKEHPLYRDFKIAAAEKHGYLKTKVVGLRGPMFTVTELAMDIAKVHGQLIIGEPVSVRLKDGSMERVWSMPKSVNYNDLVTMPTRLANENQQKFYSFVHDYLMKRNTTFTFASVVPTHDRQLSRAKDVYVEISSKTARLFVPGSRTISYGAGVIRDLKLHEIYSLQKLMKTPFSRTDKKSHSQFAEFDPSNIISVIQVLDKLDVPLFMGRHDTSVFRSGNFNNPNVTASQNNTILEDLMSEMELIVNTSDKKVSKKKGAKQVEEIEDADIQEVNDTHTAPEDQQPSNNSSDQNEDSDNLEDLMSFLNTMR